MAGDRRVMSRVLVLLALVIGVVLLQGTSCDNVAAVPDHCHSSVLQVTAELDAGMPGELDAVLELCLLVLFAVVWVLGLRRPLEVVFRARPRAIAPHRVLVRSPRLKQLCVLRV